MTLGAASTGEPLAWREARPPRPEPDVGDFVAAFVVLGLFAVAAAWFVASQWKTRKKKLQELQENRRLEEAPLRNPQFAEIELRSGCRVPQAIRELYADHATICAAGFYIIDPTEEKAAWPIARFLPANCESMQQWWTILGDVFVFATSIGGEYFVPMRALFTNPLPVFIRYNDGEVVKIADAIEDFLRWPRVSAAVYNSPSGRGEQPQG